MSDFIPNSFQVPNAYIDRVWYLLTPPEQSVLIYMARRIFGFGKRQDRISLSQFAGGTRSRIDGRQLDGGTGLGKAAVIRALDALVGFGLVCVIEPAVPAEMLAPLYELQLDSQKIDIGLLRDRKIARLAAAELRTQNARFSVPTLSVPQTAPLSVGQTHNNQLENQESSHKEFGESNSNSYREDVFDFDDDLFGGDFR